MKPPVSKEGKAAAGRIKEFRQNVNNGATAKQARAIGDVVQGKTPTIRQQKTLDSIENQALIPPKSTAQTGVADAAKARNNTTITSSDLQQEPKFNLTQPNPPVQGAALSGAIESEADAFTKNLETQKTQAEATKGTALDNYIASLQNRQGLSGFTAQQEEEQGLAPIETELNDINQQIREEQLAMRRATERLQGQGNLKGQTQTAIANIERDSIAKQADLSIIQLGVQAKYDSAIARIDRKAKALYEQEQNTIDALKFNYTENKDLFTTAEQRLFETKLGDRERKLQQDIDNRKQIDSFALQALQAGASVSEARQMMAAKTLDEALGIGGSYFRPKPVAASTKAPDLQNFGTTDNPVWKQYDPSTGSWVDVSGLGAGGAAGGETEKVANTISFLRNTIADANKLADASGPSGFSQAVGSIFVGNTRSKQLANKLDSLKVNLLTLNSDPALKKFFGPQMTERDTQLLQSAGTTLDAYSNSEADNRAELKRYSELLNKIEKALPTGQAVAPAAQTIQAPLAQGIDTRLLNGSLTTAPDGQVYEVY